MSFEVLKVKANDCIVAGDLHIPGHSTKWLQKLIAYGKEHQIPTLIHAGDFFNLDALSRFELKDPHLSLEKELAMSKSIIQKLSKQFNLFFVCGNHDLRLPLFMKGNLSFSRAVTMLFNKNIGVTDRDHLYLFSGKEKFRICHPSKYSIIKGRISSTLSQDLQEHVIMGHPHFFSMMLNKTGKYMSIELPCMCDSNAFAYKNNSTVNNPEWNNGFIHIKDGKVKIISDFTF